MGRSPQSGLTAADEWWNIEWVIPGREQRAKRLAPPASL